MNPEPVQSRSKPERKRVGKLRIFYLTVFLAGLAVVLYYGYSVFQVESEQARVEAEKAALVAEKAKLEEELKHVTDPTYIEQQARTELRMIRPGEILYVLPEKGKDKDEEGNGETHGE